MMSIPIPKIRTGLFLLPKIPNIILLTPGNLGQGVQNTA